MINLINVAKGYTGKELFSSLSWRVDAGDRIGMIGPNGVGKSTLARIIAGLEEVDRGEVNTARGRRVGYLAQEVITLPDETLINYVLGGRAELVAAIAGLAELEDQVAAKGDEQTHIAYAHALDRLNELGGYSAQAEAARILAGLQFREEDFDRRIHALSGGWLMRAALARLLFQMPDLLILDEPTNHLDLPALTWLESFLGSYRGAYLVISHDRTFLNTMVDKIVELLPGAFNEYPGGYDSYRELKERQIELDEARRKNQEQRIAQVERFINKYRAQKTRARQAGSRKKMLKLLEAELVDVPHRVKRVSFKFPQPQRSGTPVLTLSSVHKSYGDVRVFEGIDFTVARGDRIALVGPNGAGKSTLIKLAAGALRPDSGSIRPGHNVSLHYFAQHQLEALDPEKTPLQEMTALPGWDKISWLRSLLGAMLLGAREIDTRIADLSGGEKAKLALAKMLVNPANLILLDEPTNHLDPQAREVLEDALAGYTGSLVFISHDRAFINAMANRVVEIVAGRLTSYIGNYNDYLRARERAGSRTPEKEPIPSARRISPPKQEADTQPGQREKAEDRRERRRRGAARRTEEKKATAALSHRIKKLEATIAASEGKLDDIHAALSEPELTPERYAELGREEKAVREFLEQLYRQWEDVSSELEEVKADFSRTES